MPCSGCTTGKIERKLNQFSAFLHPSPVKTRLRKIILSFCLFVSLFVQRKRAKNYYFYLFFPPQKDPDHQQNWRENIDKMCLHFPSFLCTLGLFTAFPITELHKTAIFNIIHFLAVSVISEHVDLASINPNSFASHLDLTFPFFDIARQKQVNNFLEMNFSLKGKSNSNAIIYCIDQNAEFWISFLSYTQNQPIPEHLVSYSWHSFFLIVIVSKKKKSCCVESIVMSLCVIFQYFHLLLFLLQSSLKLC